MLALFRPLCWCFTPWLYSWLYTEALYHGFILGFILGFMSLGRGVSVASVASGAVWASSVCGLFLNSYVFLSTLFCFISVFIPGLSAGKSLALFRRSCWEVQKLQQLLILAYSVFIRVIRKNNSCLFCFILLYSGIFLEGFFSMNYSKCFHATRISVLHSRCYML